MGAIDYALLALIHPIEFRNLIQYSLWFQPKRDITNITEYPTSGWDRQSMQTCWKFLDETSRSFAAVIKELEGDLARVICLFYLVLRGLDTIEDDMTIPDEKKQPILRNFHKYLDQPGWTFNDNGPNEKDRQLLVEFDAVIDELNRIDPKCKAVILDIAQKMASGMADFAHRAATTNVIYVESIEEYDLYCHYVAGLVGEGLSRLFSATDKEMPYMAEQLVLSNSMGLLLQKTNILRDFREDLDEQRYFWPKEIWGQFGFKDAKELTYPENQEKALWALSGMTVDAMRHVTDALDYLTLLKNQSVFNFCAIPAVMALATLAVCFNNPNVLHRNVKIRKGQAVSLIMASTNPRDVAYLCRDFAREIHSKASPADPYFFKLSITCGRIEQWCEHHYPSFIEIIQGEGPRLKETEESRVHILRREAQLVKVFKEKEKEANGPGRQKVQIPQEPLPWTFIVFTLATFLLIIVLCAIVVYGVLWYSGEL